MTPRQRPPAYRFHKARKSAVATVGGKNIYLGPYGSLESYQQYLALISRWLTAKFVNAVSASLDRAPAEIPVAELILRYWKHAESYYIKNGQATDEQYAI